MAASMGNSKKAELSKAEYLKRYLSADEDNKKAKKNVKKKRVKAPEKGLKIVDDDIDWKQTVSKSDVENEDDDEEAPVIAEMIDERPEEVKRLEAFRTSSKWRILGADENELTEDGEEPGVSRGTRHDSPEPTSSTMPRHDSPDSVRKRQQVSLDTSPPRKGRHDSPDASPQRISSGRPQKVHSGDSSPVRRSPNLSSSEKRSTDSHQPPLAKRAQKRHDSDSDQSPPRKKTVKGKASDSDQSPPRRRDKTGKGYDSDQSPPRRRLKHVRDSDSDQSPPRRRIKGGDDLSPPRRPGHSQGPRMLSGGKAGLVSIDILRKEQEDNRRREKNNQPLEEESRNAQTVFRDKSGKKRDLDTEREEQRKKAGEKAAKDEKYAQWGKGLAQMQMQQENLEDALLVVDKPLARYRDDEDLDRMLREQEREGDPMAAMLRRKKERSSQLKGVKERPRYKGPMPPPNRFNIMPGYRWDGVNRSNGFEQKRYTRMADKRALQEEAYKWSVEDM